MLNPDLNGENLTGYAVTLTARNHTVVADEPTELGGTDLGAKPSELLLGSLAACKLITMRMYAQRKGWDLGTVTIQLKYKEKGDPTIVEKAIRFTGPLDEKQESRLLEISGRCPVAKMLKNSIIFEIV